jgi:hypothetical protein
MKCACSDFYVIRLKQGASLFSPETVQSQYNILKIHISFIKFSISHSLCSGVSPIPHFEKGGYRGIVEIIKFP